MNRIPQTILKGVCLEPDSARKKITSGWVHFRLHSSQLNNNQEIPKVRLRKEVSLKSKKKLEKWKKAWKFVIVGRDLGVSVTEQQFGQMPWASSYWGDSTGGNTETHISGVCKWARGMLFHQCGLADCKDIHKTRQPISPSAAVGKYGEFVQKWGYMVWMQEAPHVSFEQELQRIDGWQGGKHSKGGCV